MALSSRAVAASVGVVRVIYVNRCDQNCGKKKSNVCDSYMLTAHMHWICL